MSLNGQKNEIHENPISTRSKNNRNSLFSNVFFGLIYKIILDFSFIVTISSFAGAKNDLVYMQDINILKIIVSYIVCLYLIVFLPTNQKNISFLIQIIIFMVFIPMASIYGVRNESSVFFFVSAGSLLFVEISTSLLWFKKIMKFNINWIIQLLFNVIIALTIILLFIGKGVPTLNLLDFSKVYEYRASTVFGKYVFYLIDASAKVILPFKMVVAFLNKKYKSFLFYATLQLMIYLWTGHKIFLFLIIIIFISSISANFKKREKYFIVLMCLGVFTSVLMAEIWLAYRDKLTAASLLHYPFALFVDRMLYLPSLLKFKYYDFFLTNEPIGFLGTIVSPIIGGYNPYADEAIGYVISQKYFDVISNASTGIFGYDMLHFGIIGMLSTTVCLIIFFIAVKICNSKNGDKFTFCMALLPVIMLSDVLAAVDLIFSINGILTLFILIFYQYTHSEAIGGN